MAPEDFLHWEVWDGIHAGVEPTGTEIANYLDSNRLERVSTFRVHPEAGSAGRRFLCTVELGQLFLDKTLDSDPELLNLDERAIWDLFMTDKDRPIPDFSLDVHDSPMKDANALMIGCNTHPLALGIAPMLGLKHVIWFSDYPLYELCSRVVSIETYRNPRSNPLSQPMYWRERLAKMAMLTFQDLTEITSLQYRKLTYYREIELARVSPDGTVNEEMVELINELENVAYVNRCFAPFALPRAVAKALDIEKGSAVIGTFWDDNNLSAPMPEMLGKRSDGRDRRFSFGHLLVRVEPPKWTPDYRLEFTA